MTRLSLIREKSPSGGLHPFYKKTLPPVARCHPLRKTLGLSVFCVWFCLWNDVSRVPTAAVKSRVTTYMYRRATNYMSTRHVFVSTLY